VPKNQFERGILSITVKYLWRAPSGLFYYHRRVPEAVRKHYRPGQGFIRKSLKTRELPKAVKRATELAAEDDALWRSLRTLTGERLGATTREDREGAIALLRQHGLSPGDALREHAHYEPTPIEVLNDAFEQAHGETFAEARYRDDDPTINRLLSGAEREAVRLIKQDPETPRALLSEALEEYLKNHKNAGRRKFERDTRRSLSHVLNAVGDFPLSAYRRQNANLVRDNMLATGMKSGTVRRNLNTIRAVFNDGVREFDLRDARNPFEQVKLAGEGEDANNRIIYSDDALRAIAEACQARDDDIRWVVAMVADTGARNSEIVGLRVEDVFLEEPVPHVWLREHLKLGRTLKNPQSVRKLPLVGTALWGAKRAMRSAQKSGAQWLFPRYSADNDIRSNSASGTIVKWLRRVTKTQGDTHALRHKMRDRLRHVDAPMDVQDEIGGWGTRTVGQGYGEVIGLSSFRVGSRKQLGRPERQFSL